MPIYNVSQLLKATAVILAASEEEAKDIAATLDGHQWEINPAEERFDVEDVSAYCDEDDCVNV